jgi:hypothetical protein
MKPVINNWGSQNNPIVTLVSETYRQYPEWSDGPTSKTFSGGIYNVLKLPFVFKYKAPYGRSASYWIAIDRRVGSTWYRVHYKEVNFFPDDKEEHSAYEEFDLSLNNYSILWQDLELHFKIYGAIEGPGSLPTGPSGFPGGSLGYWDEFDAREFTAIFEKLDVQVGEPQLMAIEQNVHDFVNDYRVSAKKAAKNERIKEPA